MAFIEALLTLVEWISRNTSTGRHCNTLWKRRCVTSCAGFGQIMKQSRTNKSLDAATDLFQQRFFILNFTTKDSLSITFKFQKHAF